MPSATRMFAGRCRPVALTVALVTALVVPVGAAYAGPNPTTSTTTTTQPKPGPSTTTTTIDPHSVPPPPAFSLPLDYGLKLLAQRAAAAKDLQQYGAALPGDKADAAAAQ